VYAAVTRNLPLITNNKFTKDSEIVPGGILDALRPLNYHAELSNVISMHIRRGDYEHHCSLLEFQDAPYAAYNVLPGLPDTYTPDTTNRTTRDLIMLHCLPTAQQVIQRVSLIKKDYEKQNSGKATLDSVFLMTNAHEEWLDELKEGLRGMGLGYVVTWKQLQLQNYEKVADMVCVSDCATRRPWSDRPHRLWTWRLASAQHCSSATAYVFPFLYISDTDLVVSQFSTLTSTVVALRDARGALRQNSRLW